MQFMACITNGRVKTMYNEDVIYPISEVFISPQGEGRYTGTLMQFIRFAGCTVGKPFPKEMYKERYSTDTSERPLHLPIYTEQCTTYDGRTFACDTDYRVKERKTAKDLVQWACSNDVEYVLFTGGEPLMRDLSSLIFGLKQNSFRIHVETSGTIKPNLNEPWWRLINWICVSPKKGFCDEYADLNIAHEFKLLVDEKFSWRDVPDSIKRKSHKISFSPINDEHTINYDNVERCVRLQQEHPSARLTMQMHKLWGVR